MLPRVRRFFYPDVHTSTVGVTTSPDIKVTTTAHRTCYHVNSYRGFHLQITYRHPIGSIDYCLLNVLVTCEKSIPYITIPYGIVLFIYVYSCIYYFLLL